MMRRTVLAVVGLLVGSGAVALAAGPKHPSAEPEPQYPATEEVSPGLTGAPLPPKAVPAMIEGFRSAQFGITETKVRLAIRSDFGDLADEIVRAQDDLDKTLALQITVENLLSVAGKAKISYILGADSRKLTQVTIAWGAASGNEVSSESLIDAAGSLREHLLRKPFKKDDMLINWKLQDGSTVVFRGHDGKHHTILLVLAGEKQAQAADAADVTPTIKITTLMLSYIADSLHPDILRLKPKDF